MDTYKIKMFIGAGCLVPLSYWLICKPGKTPIKETSPIVEDAQPGRPLLLSDLTHRNLFKPLIAAPARPKAVPPPAAVPILPPVPKVPLSQKAARFHLVGIIPGDPAQAIIEDSQTHGTVYATPGQKIDDIEVEKILKDRVVLVCADEHLDLML